jgi:hypothetical protein
MIKEAIKEILTVIYGLVASAILASIVAVAVFYFYEAIYLVLQRMF